MNRRHVHAHVHALAVCGLVVVALAGVDGCAFGVKTRLPVPVPSASPPPGTHTQPEADITITDCNVDVSAGTLEAKLSVHNGNSRSGADYNGTVQFTDESGSVFGSAEISTDGVAGGETRPVTVHDSFLNKCPSVRPCRSSTPATGTAAKSSRFSRPATAAVRLPRALCVPYRSLIAGG
ncbi:hypothetical protein ACFXO2_07100 [Streptomyces sp. NPDC059152]|uniref:hypothetical protein n=1 Tax=Streptomyces sp. NPDC059152 TaxID=3346742 RepID=UPI00368A563E